ncbi:MAG: transglutaminase-like putative cysteine protease [Paracoccaceae bacterium]|jgi:transglutaminase-like putative cysteine protease
MRGASVDYEIRLRLSHDYHGVVGSGRHIVRAVPAQVPGRQNVGSWSLSADPLPRERFDITDFFGNAGAILFHDHAHGAMHVRITAKVTCFGTSVSLDISPDLERLAAEIAAHRSLSPVAPHHFLGQSPRVDIPEAIARYARTQIFLDATVRDIVIQLGQALHRDMTFDAQATTVDTPLIEAFNKRHGVCQDFSHIMISGLRALGIPARYVSGFLRTEPPEGQPRLEGADAMHAWVSAWCGSDIGWLEYDPTNATLIHTDHVVVAYGRDYSDVSPIKGVLRAAGGGKSSQAVDMIPL